MDTTNNGIQISGGNVNIDNLAVGSRAQAHKTIYGSTQSERGMAPDSSSLARTPRKETSSPVTTKGPLNIFYCYAHEDRALRAELAKHLSPLLRLERIINWYDGEILPGTVWEEKIMMQLNTAHIILLLVSPDFIASDYCYSKEMRRAIERHEAKEALVIPIILRPVFWNKMPFAHLQVLPSEGKPVCSSLWSSKDEAFYNVVQGISVVVEAFPA